MNDPYRAEETLRYEVWVRVRGAKAVDFDDVVSFKETPTELHITSVSGLRHVYMKRQLNAYAIKRTA